MSVHFRIYSLLLLLSLSLPLKAEGIADKWSLDDDSTRVEEVLSEELAITPDEVVLVPQLPSRVKILSLNNSLIECNSQDEVFVEIAGSMGHECSWTKHTLLGMSLQTHWDEGEGLTPDQTPSARMMVRSDHWTHIILQERSTLPRLDPEGFRNSVKLWVDYIRENCPNPNAVIILPMNWAYSNDWDNFLVHNRELSAQYSAVAKELGVVVCPIAEAYSKLFEAEGPEGAQVLFYDDRHPTKSSTYMAACMEFSLIYGDNVMSLPGYISTLTPDEAYKMRYYAAQGMDAYENVVDHHAATVKFDAVLSRNGEQVDSDEPIGFAVEGPGTIDLDGLFHATGAIGECTVTAKTSGMTAKATVKVAAPLTEDVASAPRVTFHGESAPETGIAVVEGENMEVFNLCGVKLMEGREGNLHTDTLPHGLYVVKRRHDSHTEVSKIVL